MIYTSNSLKDFLEEPSSEGVHDKALSLVRRCYLPRGMLTNESPAPKFTPIIRKSEANDAAATAEDGGVGNPR